MFFYFDASSTGNPHFTCSSLPGMTEFGGFFHDIFKSQSHSEGLWDLGRACRGLEETGYEHTYSLLGLLSHTVLKYELLPPAPLNLFSSLSTQGLNFQTHVTSSPMTKAAHPSFLSLLTQAPSVFTLAMCRGGGKGMRWRIHDSSCSSTGKSNSKQNQKARLKTPSPRKSNSLQT